MKKLPKMAKNRSKFKATSIPEESLYRVLSIYKHQYGLALKKKFDKKKSPFPFNRFLPYLLENCIHSSPGIFVNLLYN